MDKSVESKAPVDGSQSLSRFVSEGLFVVGMSERPSVGSVTLPPSDVLTMAIPIPLHYSS